ncbi:hypothetical protein RHMOL_Rhmol11G0112800 [Rhododendron molle]|uniref:Uncharacterized protein n=1 Tax=Rhododendron molle TaxID=49168 RepID=A0ACC0LRV5_RHOML|nr:hypothetical protein RHMOL_Rhmol11G0112800 [Rhododendron molle]
MTELLKHPQAMKKLQAEVGRTTQSNPTQPAHNRGRSRPNALSKSRDQGDSTPPPSGSPSRASGVDQRRPSNGLRRCGRDTRVVINAWSIGRDPASWDEPEEFWPKRFSNGLVDFRGQDFELIPFGAGRRGCPGIQFATAVDELAIANLVHKLDFALPNGVELDVKKVAGLTVHQKLPLLLVANSWSC